MLLLNQSELILSLVHSAMLAPWYVVQHANDPVQEINYVVVSGSEYKCRTSAAFRQNLFLEPACCFSCEVEICVHVNLCLLRVAII